MDVFNIYLRLYIHNFILTIETHQTDSEYQTEDFGKAKQNC